jgi:hypothetical protein
VWRVFTCCRVDKIRPPPRLFCYCFGCRCPGPFRTQLNVNFFEKQEIGWAVFRQTEKVRWEHWAIPIVVTRGAPQSGDDTRLERSLQQSVLKVLEHAQHIDHVPRIRVRGILTTVMYDFEVRTHV